MVKTLLNEVKEFLKEVNTEKKTIFVSNNIAGVCRGHITRRFDINSADFFKIA